MFPSFAQIKEKASASVEKIELQCIAWRKQIHDPIKAPPDHTAEFYVCNAGMKTGIKAFCQIVLDYLSMK